VKSFVTFITIVNRSFWGSGRPRVPGGPFQKLGGFAPDLLEGSPGPPGPPSPYQNSNFYKPPNCSQAWGLGPSMSPNHSNLYCLVTSMSPKPMNFFGPAACISQTPESHRLKVSGRRRNTSKSGHNRSESLCAGFWAPCRIFWAWFGFASGPNPVRNRRFPAGSLNIFGALVAQPSLVSQNLSPEFIFVDLCSAFQTGAVENGPGPNCGRTTTQKRLKTDPKPTKLEHFWGPLSSAKRSQDSIRVDRP
jgi:hypothetical protein